VFSGIVIAEEVDGVGDKESGDTTTIHVQTFLEAFLNMSLTSACSLMKLFSDKKQNFCSWHYCPQVSDYRDFLTVTCRMVPIQ
jgi:hypothetical protein